LRALAVFVCWRFAHAGLRVLAVCAWLFARAGCLRVQAVCCALAVSALENPKKI
jgi:hypothetical protein